MAVAPVLDEAVADDGAQPVDIDVPAGEDDGGLLARAVGIGEEGGDAERPAPSTNSLEVSRRNTIAWAMAVSPQEIISSTFSRMRAKVRSEGPETATPSASVPAWGTLRTAPAV